MKECPVLIEKVLEKNSLTPINDFLKISLSKLKDNLVQDTIRAEFGDFEYFVKKSSEIRKTIYLPKYYSPSIEEELTILSKNCNLVTFGVLKQNREIDYYTGDEIGKMAYGTGNIPFIRTSDFSNWEIIHNPKQGISEDIYSIYTDKKKVKEGDIFLVRDGTYLIGTSCIVTKEDAKCLFCGGLYKISVLESPNLYEWILLDIINSYIIKRQIRTKQFTRDVIDTIGRRIDEIILPIPKSKKIREGLSRSMKEIVQSRVGARNRIKTLVNTYGE